MKNIFKTLLIIVYFLVFLVTCTEVENPTTITTTEPKITTPTTIDDDTITIIDNGTTTTIGNNTTTTIGNNTATTIGSTTTTTEKTPLAAPKGLASGTITANSITFTWGSVDYASSYEVHQSTSASGTYTKVTANITISGSVISVTITELSANTTYYYKVKAIGGDDYLDSELSDCISIITTFETTIYVNSGSGNSQGTKSNPYRTIQEAVNTITPKKNTIYVTKSTYNERVNIINAIPITIKGGYNNSWTRTNPNDMTIINGNIGAAASNKTGAITIGVDSKVTLENLNIKGSLYKNKYSDQCACGIFSKGDLTIDNCDIVGIETATATTIYDDCGIYIDDESIYYSNPKLVIRSGTIKGAAKGDINYTYGVCIFSKAATVTIENGTIIGATNNANVINEAHGICNYGSGNIVISNGTIKRNSLLCSMSNLIL